MDFLAPAQQLVRTRAKRRSWSVAAWRRWLHAGLGLLFLLAALGVRAADRVELSALLLSRDDEGVYLHYAVDLELSRGVEEALAKAVPLFFVAQAQVFRSRWYWTDRRVAEATRTWRIVFQPLTSSYRVTFGGLSQSYGSRAEALAAISRGSRWKIADAGQIEEGSRHHVIFNFRLDTTLLPRPMQIGIGNQADWQLNITRTLRLD